MVGKGKVSQSGGSTPPPPITRTKWRKSAVFGMFLFIFCFHFAPLWNTFPPYDAPKPRFPPHKFCRCQNHHWVPCVGLVGEMHSYLSWLLPSELKKKKEKEKRKKDRQTHFRIMLFPSQCPHTHTPSLSHTPQTHLFDASTPPKKKRRIKNRCHVLHLSLMGMSSLH